MTPIIDFFWGLGPWNWFLLAVVLFLLETLLPGVLFIWFGLAAAIVGLLGLSMQAPWPVQLVAFAVTSVVMVFLVRRYTRSGPAESDVPDLNVRAAQYVGRVVVVVDQIVGGRGKVRVGDTMWPAQGTDAAAGTRVRVTGVNGTVLIVEPETV